MITPRSSHQPLSTIPSIRRSLITRQRELPPIFLFHIPKTRSEKDGKHCCLQKQQADITLVLIR